MKKRKKWIATVLSVLLVVANVLYALPEKTPQAAEVGEATDIEYNVDARILTQNGLGKLNKYKQSLAGAKWIALPGQTAMVADETIYRVGVDSKSGLDKYVGKVGNLIPMQSNANETELKNLIFNLPPFRTAKSVQASAGVTSAIRDTADYVRMYLTANGMDHATADEKTIIAKMAGTPVDETKLKVGVGPFDASHPAKVSGEYAYYGPINFEVNKRAMEGSVAVMNVTDNGMVSVVDSRMAELDKGKLDLSQVYYLKVLNTQKIRNVTITLSLQTPVEKLAFYTNHLTDTSAGYCVVPYVEIQEQSASVDVGSFGKLGTIRVRCTDVDSGEPLPGATFVVETAKDGALRRVIETNEKGYASCASLPVGEYKVYQQNTVDGYDKSTADKFPVITADGVTIDIAYTNRKYDSYAKFTILDERGAALNGGSIGVYEQPDKLVASGVVDHNGSFSIRLKAGRYVAKQLTAKEGYLVDTKAYPFQIQNNTDVITHTFTNAKIKGSVTVTFTDPDEEQSALSSGYFALTDKEGRTVSGPYKMTAGSYTVNGLLPGTYYVKQTTAPTGYQLNDNRYVFTITSNSQVATVNIPNIKKKGAISITALDEDGRFLAGVTFELWKESGKKAGEGLTNANGQIVFSNLPVGTYRAFATKVPAGYVLNDSTTIRVIAEEGQTAAGQHTYRYVRGTVQFRKVDSQTLAGVPGAILSVRNPDNVEIARVTTDKDGLAEWELSYGNYLVWEVDPGDGYTPIGKSQAFAIETNGETVQVLLDSVKITSDVVISAHRSTAVYDTIPGASFSLLKDDGRPVSRYQNVKTNENGQCILKDLAYGSYYIQQTATAFDCIPYDQKIPVNVSVNGEVIEVEVINAVKTGSITLLYRDKETKDPIFGAEFTLFHADTHKIVDAQYTNRSGIVYYTKVPYGKYYIKMTVAAPGYELDTSIIGLSEAEAAEKEASRITLFQALPVYAATAPQKRYIIIDDNTPHVSIGGGNPEEEDKGQIGDSEANVNGSGATNLPGGSTGGNGNTGGTSQPGGSTGGNGNTGGTSQPGGSTGGNSNTGGTSQPGGSTGGNSNTGGTSQPGGSTGGNGNTGGTSQPGGSTGGNSNTGGTSQPGGSTGGNGDTGGTSQPGGSTGGNSNTGGTSQPGGSTGGNSNTGGTSQPGGSTGGNSNTGGTSQPGGSTGGNSNTGGTSQPGGSTGGNSNTGGTSQPGGSTGGNGDTGGTSRPGGSGNEIIVEGNKVNPTIPSVHVPVSVIPTPEPTVAVNGGSAITIPTINDAIINEELAEDVLLSEEQTTEEEGEEMELSELKEEEEAEAEAEAQIELSEEQPLENKKKPVKEKERNKSQGGTPATLPKTGTNELEAKQLAVLVATLLSLCYTAWEWKPWKKWKKG